MERTRPAGRGARDRRVNLALGGLLALAILTGIFANTIGTDWLVDPIAVHAAVALALLLLMPWKQAIVRRGLTRARPGRWRSLTLMALVAVTLVSGLAHATGLADRLGPLTLMQLHVGAALLAPVALVAHWRLHPVRPRRVDVDRRALVAAGSLSLAATAAWWAWESTLGAAGVPGAARRFTGSVERASGDPSRMPVFSWLDDRVPRVDAAAWRLDLDGLGLSAAEIAALPQETFTATLDCTSGWYSEQRWRGVRLDRLLALSGRPADRAGQGSAIETLAADGWRSVLVTSSTGYARRFPIADLDATWLVTAVGDRPLSPGHGFPARIVAPNRRAFWWVKWVTSVQLSRRPWWVQLPFPPT